MQLNQTKSCGKRNHFQSTLPGSSIPLPPNVVQSTRTQHEDRSNNNVATVNVDREIIRNPDSSITTEPIRIPIDATPSIAHKPMKNKAADSVGNKPAVVGYDYFENHHRFNASAMENETVDRHGQFNETVQIVNINRTKMDENNAIDTGNTDLESYFITSRRAPHHKNLSPTKMPPMHENEVFDYNHGTTHFGSRIFTVLLIVCSTIPFINI